MPPALWFVAGEGIRKEKCVGFVGPLLFPYVFDVWAHLFPNLPRPAHPSGPSAQPGTELSLNLSPSQLLLSPSQLPGADRVLERPKPSLAVSLSTCSRVSWR